MSSINSVCVKVKVKEANGKFEILIVRLFKGGAVVK